MNKINWSTYKFHCSGLSNLMVNGRSKKDPLSETTKSYLNELYIQETYGRKKLDTVTNKYMRKGTMCETDSLELVEKVLNKKYFKNQKTIENNYIIGTPDVITPDLVDIKTSWDLFTFAKVTEKQAEYDYYYQLLGYMWLTEKNTSSIIYCLVDTPEIMVNDEMYRLQFYMPEEEAEKYINNFIFNDIPEKSRIKKYEFQINQEEITKLIERIQLSREYLSQLSL